MITKALQFRHPQVLGFLNASEAKAYEMMMVISVDVESDAICFCRLCGDSQTVLVTADKDLATTAQREGIKVHLVRSKSRKNFTSFA